MAKFVYEIIVEQKQFITIETNTEIKDEQDFWDNWYELPDDLDSSIVSWEVTKEEE